MKLKNLFSVAAMGLAMISCGNDEPSGNNNAVSGSGYLAVKINLPSTTGSRAASYEEGLANEYSVNDAMMYVWKKAGTTEDDYTFVCSADLGKPTAIHPSEKDEEGVYSDFLELAELPELLTNDKGEYYALIMLNIKAGDFDVNAPAVGTKYADWNTATNVAVSTDFKPQFFMANSAIMESGAERPTTLVKIDVTKIQPTVEAARAAGAGVEVYVERGVAKVTVKKPAENYSVTGATYKDDKVVIESWTLDVTNKKTFTVHKTMGLREGFSTIWSGRFLGNHRVYWGIDPNYNDCELSTEADIATHFNRATESNYKAAFDAENPQYCLENTFDIDHMLQGQTTRVVFKAKYTPKGIPDGADFFMLKGEIYSRADIVKYIKGRAMEAAKLKGVQLAETEIAVDIPNGAAAAGVITVTKDFFNVPGGQIVVDDAFVGNVVDLIPGDILRYNQGVNYYAARIRHFDDIETPWEFGDDTYGVANSENRSKYLGRYGVLRNNWYELEVTAVSSPGSPVLPEIDPDSPDDENTYYLQTKCYILKWAKRTQQITL